MLFRMHSEYIIMFINIFKYYFYFWFKLFLIFFIFRYINFSHFLFSFLGLTLPSGFNLLDSTRLQLYFGCLRWLVWVMIQVIGEFFGFQQHFINFRFMLYLVLLWNSMVVNQVVNFMDSLIFLFQLLIFLNL